MGTDRQGNGEGQKIGYRKEGDTQRGRVRGRGGYKVGGNRKGKGEGKGGKKLEVE